MWDTLARNLNLDSGANTPHRLTHKQAGLQTMMQYIHDHYMEEITLDMIAASASVSKSGTLQIFQSVIHISSVAYLIQYRLAQAAGQLHTTRIPSISPITFPVSFRTIAK